MPISEPTTTLQAIQKKVRRLTRTPSTDLLSDDELNNYINTFVVYDFPEHLRLFNLLTTFTFYTNPYQDVYPTDKISFGGVTTNPLYNFQNKYISIQPPVFIAGYQSLYSQSREQFYGIYPIVNSIASIATTGDGVTTTFSGVVNAQNAVLPSNLQQQQVGLLQYNVLFSSVDTDSQGLALVDVPVLDTTTGNNTTFGNLYVPGSEPATPPTTVLITNFIDYSTGEFTITFPFAPGAGKQIFSQTVPQVTSLPQALLFFDNKLIVRPVPNQPYRINFQAYIRPSALLDTAQSPQLEEWWQYIAYGAAKKVFEDRMDTDSVAQILPEYKKQEALCLRRTLVQNSTQRTATIYTEQTSFGSNSGFGWGGQNI